MLLQSRTSGYEKEQKRSQIPPICVTMMLSDYLRQFAWAKVNWNFFRQKKVSENTR